MALAKNNVCSAIEAQDLPLRQVIRWQGEIVRQAQEFEKQLKRRRQGHE